MQQPTQGAKRAHADYHALDAVGGSTVSKIASSGALRDALVPFAGSDAATIGSCVDARWIEGMTPEPEQWEPFAPYQEKYAHPLWKELQEEAKKSGGHGGADYITMYEFVKAVRNRTQPPQDVYDAATWSAIVPLTCQSVAEGSRPIPFPDFTNGKWKTNKPVPIYGA